MLLMFFYFLDYYLLGLMVASVFTFLSNYRIDDIHFFYRPFIWPLIIVATILAIIEALND